MMLLFLIIDSLVLNLSLAMVAVLPMVTVEVLPLDEVGFTDSASMFHFSYRVFW